MTTIGICKNKYKVEKHIIDEDDEESKFMFSIIWDEKNKKLDKRYAKDYTINFYDKTLNDKRDYSYVKFLKFNLNWKEGDIIYFFSKSNVDGAYFLFQGGKGEDKITEKYADFCIDEQGYWRAKIDIIDPYWGREDKFRYRGEYSFQEIWLRMNCKFNDRVLKSLEEKQKDSL